MKNTMRLAFLLLLAACGGNGGGGSNNGGGQWVPRDALLICCGSVSSGFSGKPTGEYIAEAMNLRVQQESTVCRDMHERVDDINFSRAAVVVNLDGSYWASLDRECGKGVEGVRKFYAKAAGARVVIATVPEVVAGAFFRGVCGAESAVQTCRAPLNQAIREGCVGNCLLLDGDELYGRHKELAQQDIHLTPEIWRDLAPEILEKMK